MVITIRHTSSPPVRSIVVLKNRPKCFRNQEIVQMHIHVEISTMPRERKRRLLHVFRVQISRVQAPSVQVSSVQIPSRPSLGVKVAEVYDFIVRQVLQICGRNLTLYKRLTCIM